MKKITFEIIKGILTVDGQTVDIPEFAENALEYGGLLIVKLDPPTGVVFNRNVFGITAHSHVQWQIEESPHGTQDDKPFTDVYIDNEGSLIAANWNGVSYSVDPDNGKITVSSFDK